MVSCRPRAARLCPSPTAAKYDGSTAPLRPWRGGRVVECTALEMRHTGNRIGGSNPSLSASHRHKILILLIDVQVILFLSTVLRTAYAWMGSNTAGRNRRIRPGDGKRQKLIVDLSQSALWAA